ncbi:glycosyltransferase, partial [Streptomyces sp. NPDC002537]
MTDQTTTPRPGRGDVVLPCLDEAAALPWVLARVPEGWRAIVVDNGSADGSADLARSLGATVVHEPRRGFGAAKSGEWPLEPAHLPNSSRLSAEWRDF